MESDSKTKDNIYNLNFSEEIKKSFLEYAMSVIISRAIPSVYDGLKPVHRRIIYAMEKMGVTSHSAYKKSARIVGEVIGKYHPHGDSAVYNTIVRMAQDFSFRYPLVQGHGNFGSIDGDAPAAMRYTEIRLSKISAELSKDIDKKIVPFEDNYDGSEIEPARLPCYFPNLLANGSQGIAVGLATNIPPHNLTELIDACILMIKNPQVSIYELMRVVKAPDFPTGGYLACGQNLMKAYLTGNGSVVMRGKYKIEDNPNSKYKKIVFYEIPYQVNKKDLLEKIVVLVKNKVINEIHDLRDESNYKGIRIVIEVKRSVANTAFLVNKLYKYTLLQNTFSINMVALVDKEPKLLPLKKILALYIQYQIDLIVKKYTFNLSVYQKKWIINSGLIIALNNIDEVIKIIKQSKDKHEALKNLIAQFNFQEVQAKAILDMRLNRLTNLEQTNLKDDLARLEKLIAECHLVIDNIDVQNEYLIKQLTEIKKIYGDERRSEIINTESFSIDDEALIKKEDCYIVTNQANYIKRLSFEAFRVQKRGGMGVSIGKIKNNEDVINNFVHTNTLSDIYLLTNLGRIYRFKSYQVPLYERNAKGLPIINLIEINEEEKIVKIFPHTPTDKDEFFFFVTEQGKFLKLPFSLFNKIYNNGKLAINLREGDKVADACIASKESIYVILSSNAGLTTIFDHRGIRTVQTRNARGVFRMKLKNKSKVVKMLIADDLNKLLLTVSKKGYSKMSHLKNFRIRKHAVFGINSLNLKKKKDVLLSTVLVNEEDTVFATSSANKIINVKISDFRVLGRYSMGSKMMRLGEGEYIQNLEVVN